MQVTFYHWNADTKNTRLLKHPLYIFPNYDDCLYFPGTTAKPQAQLMLKNVSLGVQKVNATNVLFPFDTN